MPAALHPIAVSDDVEVLIAGGGLIGLLLGTACASAGLEVAIVDPTDPAALLNERFDGRCSAIAYGSRRVLEALGLWSEIAAGAEPIVEIRVADDQAPLFLHYDHRQLETGRGTGDRRPHRAAAESVRGTGRHAAAPATGGTSMSLISLVVSLIIIGVLLYLVENSLPISPPIKTLIRLVVVVVVVLWLLQAFVGDIQVPRLRAR